MAKKTKKKLTEKQQLSVRNMFMNALTTRSNLIREQLDPRRQLDVDCGYITDPTAADFDDMYTKEGFAKRAVHIIPDESWQVDPEVFEVEGGEATVFEKAWEQVLVDNDLFSIMHRIDKLSGIGRFGVLLLGLDDGLPLDQPVISKNGRQLTYLRVFDESVITIARSDPDVTSPRYGQPVMYSISFEDTTEGNTTKNLKWVHYTRCVHIADNRRMSDVLGVPRMRDVFNRLQDLRKLLGGSAEMFWQGAFPGLSFEVDSAMLEAGAADIDTDALKEAMQDYVNGLQRWFSTAGVSVKSLAPQVADPESHITQQLKAIAIALGIPYRVFTGSEEGKLAGGQDAKAWAGRIKQRQNKYLTPYLVRPVVQALVDVGALPEPAEINVSWPDMLTPSEQEKADVIKTQTEAMKTYVQGGVDMLVPEEVYLTEFMKLDPELIEKILVEIEQKAAEEAEEMAAAEEAAREEAAAIVSLQPSPRTIERG